MDTGRLRESIHADYPEYDREDEVITTTIVFGDTEESPTERDDGKGVRMVDYSHNLEDITQNISEDILFQLNALY